MSLQHYKHLLHKLGLSTGIPDLAPDEDNYCCLGFDDTIIVHLKFDADNEQLMLFCRVGKVDENKSATLYPRLLKANLFWQGTAGSTLGLDEETKDILMSYQTPISHMDYPQFQTTLEIFINTCELWIKTLDAINKTSIPDLRQPPPNLSNGIKA